MMIALLSVIVCLFVGIANERANIVGTDEPLQKCIVICMVLITIFGGVMVDVGTLRTNAGAVLYTAVLALQYIIMRRFGWEAGQRCVVSTFIALTMLAVIMAVFAELVGTDPLGQAYAIVIETSRRLTVASFVAFAFGQALFVLMYRASRNFNLALGYGVNIVVVQAVDSLIFFPIAFGFENFGARLAFSGYLIKVGLGLLAAPLLSLALRRRAG